ncbi:hypothetical protein BLSTO_01806 [Blastocystis sp. subtype 1]
MFSYTRTPFTVETEYKAEVNSTVKVCEDGEWNILHFMEDKIITMTATHDQFSIVNMNGRKGMFSDLLSWKYGKLIPNLHSFGHLIDSKREGSELTVVVTPFTSPCYTFVNEKEDEDLIIDVHVETRMCYYVLCFLLFNTIALGCCPKVLIFEIVFFLLSILYVEAFNYYHPLLLAYSCYAQYIAPYFSVPLLTVANGVTLLFCHFLIRLVDLSCFLYTVLTNHGKDVFYYLGYSIAHYTSIANRFIYTHLQLFSEVSKQWATVYWKEITVALVLMMIAVYIFYPWKLNLTIQIRFGSTVAIAAALAYTDLPLMAQLLLISIIFVLLVLMLKDAVGYTWTYFVRVMGRYKH